MSYCVKRCHFWECVQIKFVWPVIVRLDIRNPYVHPNMDFDKTGICTETDRFHQYPGSTI